MFVTVLNNLGISKILPVETEWVLAKEAVHTVVPEVGTNTIKVKVFDRLTAWLSTAGMT